MDDSGIKLSAFFIPGEAQSCALNTKTADFTLYYRTYGSVFVILIITILSANKKLEQSYLQFYANL